MNTPTQEPRGPVWQWPRFVPATALRILLGHLAVGLANASWVAVEFRAERISIPLSRPLLWEVTGLFGAFLAFPILLTAVLNAPRPAGRWGRFFRIHLLAYALYALLVPALFLLIRHALYPLLGWGPYEYGPLALKLPMEWIKLLVAYAAIAFSTAAWLNFRESQTRARQEAELREKLQEARLEALSAQLDPHFLFNALNTVSSLMYEDLPRTDSLLASLAQMLRDGLESGGPAWPLQREWQHLEAFLAFSEARFGDRLRVRRELQGELSDVWGYARSAETPEEESQSHGRVHPGQSAGVRGYARSAEPPEEERQSHGRVHPGQGAGVRGYARSAEPPEKLTRWPVPRLCLQRLVENALKHNLEAPERALNLSITAREEDGWLHLEVEDDGLGFPDPAGALEGHGLGLRNLVDVLGLLYGGRASLQVENRPQGGARVALRIPLEADHA